MIIADYFWFGDDSELEDTYKKYFLGSLCRRLDDSGEDMTSFNRMLLKCYKYFYYYPLLDRPTSFDEDIAAVRGELVQLSLESEVAHIEVTGELPEYYCFFYYG